MFSWADTSPVLQAGRDEGTTVDEAQAIQDAKVKVQVIRENGVFNSSVTQA